MSARSQQSFGWAVPDQRKQQPWKYESFNGYFTDIRRAARRSLPRNPSRDLRTLLGMPLTPGRLEQDLMVPSGPLVSADSQSTVALPTKQSVTNTADRPPDNPLRDQESISEKVKHVLMCRSSCTEDWSSRERTILSFSVYCCITICLLLIIVLVLSFTLSKANDQTSSSTESSRKITSTTTNPSSSKATQTPPLTTKRVVSTGSTVASFISWTSSTISVTPTTESSSDKTSKSSTKQPNTTANSKLTTKNSNLTTDNVTNMNSTVSVQSTTKLPSVSSSSVAPNNTTSLPPSITTTTTINHSLFPLIQPQSATCSSKECLAANASLSKVDFSKSPCVDFYEFACGKWDERKKVDKMNGRENVPNTVQEEMRQRLLLEIADLLQEPYREDESFSAKVSKRLYQSCQESNRNEQSLTILVLQDLHKILDPLGMKENGNILGSVNVLLFQAVTQFAVTPFFKMSTVSIINNGKKKQALKIEPLSEFQDRNVYTQPVGQGTASYRYVETLTTILWTYLSSFGLDNIDVRRKRQTSGNQITDFESVFAEVLGAYYIESNLSKIVDETKDNLKSVRVDISEVRSTYPSINWTAVIGVSKKTFEVEVYNTDYFTKLNDLLTTFTKTDLKLYTFLKILIDRAWPYMLLPVRSLLPGVDNYGEALYTDTDCVEKALELAREEIHALYIGKHTQRVLLNREKLVTIENIMGDTFAELVAEASWIQADLKRAVTALSRNLVMHFSPINSVLQQTAGITGQNQTFLSLAQELHRQNYDYMAGVLGNEVTEVRVDWTSNNVYFDAYFNAIGLPTGLTVFLDNSAPDFDLYGTIGKVMAKEYLKILTGSLDGGNPPSWWSNNNVLGFDTVQSCFLNQIGKIPNSADAKGHAIILNGAFQIANQMYLDASSDPTRLITGTSVSENQLFILNTAQIHCQIDDDSQSYRLSRTIINNMIKNNINLQHMFSCPNGSPLHLESNDKCSLFT